MAFLCTLLKALMFSFFFHFRNMLLFSMLGTCTEVLLQNQDFQIGCYYTTVLQIKFDVNRIWKRFDEIVKKWRWNTDSLIKQPVATEHKAWLITITVVNNRKTRHQRTDTRKSRSDFRTKPHAFTGWQIHKSSSCLQWPCFPNSI